MYAKTLVLGPPISIPTVVGTTSAMDELLPELINHGWSPYGAEFTGHGDGRLNLTLDQRLQVIVGGKVILDDTNPIAPPGWYEATEAIGGRCIVIVLRPSDVDLTLPDVADTMRDLLDQPGVGAWTPLPIEHR